jgi:hypothetical protein
MISRSRRGHSQVEIHGWRQRWRGERTASSATSRWRFPAMTKQANSANSQDARRSARRLIGASAGSHAPDQPALLLRQTSYIGFRRPVDGEAAAVVIGSRIRSGAEPSTQLAIAIRYAHPALPYPPKFPELQSSAIATLARARPPSMLPNGIVPGSGCSC